MNLYLDDERQTPPGFQRTYTAQETIEVLKTNQVKHLSLDHDLGDNNGTGYDVLLWIEEQVIFNNFNPPTICIHSANSGAWPKMIQAVQSINKHKENK